VRIWPGQLSVMHEVALAGALEHLALGVDQLRLTPKNGFVAEPGFSAWRRAAA
jgi:hypothetical protein